MIGKGPIWLHSLHLIELFPDLTSCSKFHSHGALQHWKSELKYKCYAFFFVQMVGSLNDTKIDIPLKLYQKTNNLGGCGGLQGAHPYPSTPSHTHLRFLGRFWRQFLDSLGENFGSILRTILVWFWTNFETILRWIGNYFEDYFWMILGMIWGMIVSPFWADFEANFGPIMRTKVVRFLGQFWSDVGPILGPIFRRFWDNFGTILWTISKQFWDNNSRLYW
jgi:hypothetical protein